MSEQADTLRPVRAKAGPRVDDLGRDPRRHIQLTEGVGGYGHAVEIEVDNPS